ncbi:MAG: hypothetical protein MZU97_13090 [Bacillus subtilis]|nr:hypothetical protein [Bacillus subtilis]
MLRQAHAATLELGRIHQPRSWSRPLRTNMTSRVNITIAESNELMEEKIVNDTANLRRRHPLRLHDRKALG